MTDFVQNETGSWVRDPEQGHWRRASAEESEAAGAGTLSTIGRFIGQDLQDLAAIATMPASMREGFTEGPARLLGEMQDRQAQNAPYEQMRPDLRSVATGIQVAADPLNFLPYGRVAGKGGQTIAGRVAKRTAQNVARYGDDAARSVGAAETRNPGGMRGLLDMIFEPGELTAQQRALVPVANKVDFKFLPGQVDGNRVFLESLQSHPVTAQAFQHELGHNAAQLQKLFLRSMGLDDTQDFTRDVLRLSRQQIGGRFDDVRNAVPEGRLIGLDPDDMAAVQELKVLSPRQRRIPLEGMNGKQTFEVRSRLNKRMADYYRNGETTAGDDLADIINALDDKIGDAIGPDMVEAWRTARMQWRVRLAAKRPGVITPDGDVSLKSLTRNLEKQFEREFGETLLPDDAFRRANPEIADLMDFTRVARSFASNLPDSGTATRQTIGRILAGDFKEVALAHGVRKLVEGTAILQ